MAPTKGTSRTTVASQVAAINAMSVVGTRGRALTRRAVNANVDANMENMQTRAKRKADNSPIKNDKIKRSALGNLTNNVKIMTLHPSDEDAKQKLPKKPTAQQLQALLDAKNTENFKAMVAAGAPLLEHLTAPAPSSLPAAAPVPTKKMKMDPVEKGDDGTDVIERGNRGLDEAIATRQKRRPAPAAQKKPAAATVSQVAAVPPAAPEMKKLCAPPPPAVNKPVRRISNDFNKTEESLYMSALEDVSSCESMRLSGNFEAARRRSAKLQQKTEQSGPTQESLLKASADAAKVAEIPPVPKDVVDFDRKNWDDPFQVSHYAMDIFNYLKLREPEFVIHDYMPKQIHLTTWMRTLLVDWMVEVQETFELNHETLYLAVKIVDLYLCREVINKEQLQLLGAAAFFIACKYDERQPPLIEDFLYICDGAYKHDELVRMEMETLRVIKYDLGIPLSYRFLRRYARCAEVQMPTLTLARYILELSLMDYATIGFSDSQLASAALYMALRMHGGVANLNEQTWTPTLVYYSGYELAQFADLVPILNVVLHRKPRPTVKTVRNKYSHKIFHEVAKVPLLTNQQMFQGNLDLDESNAT